MRSAGHMVFPKHMQFMYNHAYRGCNASCLVSCAFGAWASDRPVWSESSVTGPETILVKSMQEIAESRMDSALSGVEQLLKTNPNFRLAHLIKGDLLLARARPISEIGDTVGVSAAEHRRFAR